MGDHRLSFGYFQEQKNLHLFLLFSLYLAERYNDDH